MTVSCPVLQHRDQENEGKVTSSTHAMSRAALKIATIGVDKYSLVSLREAIDKMPVFEIGAELPSNGTDRRNAELEESLQQRRYDVYVIDFDADREQAAATAEVIHRAGSGVDVFALSANADPDVIIHAMHAGCTEYLIKPLAKERVIQALVRLEHKRRSGMPAKKGKVFTLVGVKGGTGVTTLATHISCYSAQLGAKTLLIDQHADLGDISVYLSLGEHRYHFFELVNNIHRLDAQLLEGFLQQHESGLHVLPSPESFGAIVQASPTALHHTLAFLRELYDVIIIDCAPGLNGTNVVSIEEADAVYLVATPELAAIRNMARCLDHLKRYNCPDSKIHIVINRYSKRAAITQQQIEKAIQRSVSLTIPNSYPDVIGAIHSGQPMPYSSKSELVSSLWKWAASLTGLSQPSVADAPKRRLGILGL